MNVSLAFYHLCRRFQPSGIVSVAQLMAMSPDLLQKKLSPTCTTHHLTVDEAEAITVLTKDPAGAVALAAQAGFACIPLPESAGEGTLMKGMSEMGKEFSDILNAFNEAVLDNRVTPNECDKFQRELIEFFVAGIRELDRMREHANTRAPVVSIAGARGGA